MTEKELIDQHIDLIYSLIHRRFPNKDEGLISDCFFYIYQKLHENNFARVRRFQGKSAFTTYLITVVNNLITDFGRRLSAKKRNRSEVRLIEEKTNDTACRLEGVLEEEETQRDVKEALEKLGILIKELCSEKQLILKLRFEDHLKPREIASFFPGTNGKKISYKLRKIEDELKQLLVKQGVRKEILFG